jgi:hypothetical protein
MTDLVLLRVDTDTVRLEIRGPVAHRLGSISAGRDVVGSVSVEGAGLLSIQAQSDQRTWRDLTEGDPSAPLFFEDTRYRLSVVTKSGTVPSLRERDSSLLREVDSYPDQGMLAGPINFGRQVGHADLHVESDGQTLTVSLEVFPTKLDYATDYQDVLHDIAGAARALGLEYLRSTYTRGGVEAVDDTNTDVEWLTLVRQELDALEAALAYVVAHPHRALVATPASVRLDKIRRLDASSRRAAVRGLGQGPWVMVPGVGRLRGEIPANRREETLDTPEHRWLAQAVRVVRDRLTQVHAGLASEIEVAKVRGRNIARMLSEAAEVEEFVLRTSRLVASPVLQGSGGPIHAGFTSLTLLTAPGYGEAFRALMTLRLGLHIDGDVLDLNLKDLSALYEAWCFIRVARSASLHATTMSGSDAVAVTERGLRINLVHGQSSAIRLRQRGHTITLWYNPTYAGLTGDQRPDIVIEIRFKRWPKMFIVLDAKYRLNADDKYLARYRVPGPPEDAMNALHRYRDAIVLSEAGKGLGRPVVMGAALYPLDAASAANWPSSRLYEALTTLGIGAIPYLPSNTGYLDAWLTHLLGVPPRDLARPGPPFSALEAYLAGRV